MPITSKSTLETELANWLHRTDLSGQYEEWEQMAEELFKGEIRRPTDPQISGVRVGVTRATGTLSTSNAYISKPTGFMNGYYLSLTATHTPLRYVAPDVMPTKMRTGSGQPRYWTVADVILFDVLPDSAYAYELAYYAIPVTLVGAASGDTNTVLTAAPLCYLAACLHFAFDYIADSDNASKWLGRYKIYADNANAAFREQQYSSGAIAATHEYSTP